MKQKGLLNLSRMQMSGGEIFCFTDSNESNYTAVAIRKLEVGNTQNMPLIAHQAVKMLKHECIIP